MAKTTADISVIICAYTEERWHDLVAAVESVQRQILPAEEIIIVVDHNASLMQRVQAQLLDVTIVENTEEPGLSEARNSGIAAINSQIIAFLDDDAVAEPDWLMLLSAEFADTRVLGVGGSVMPLWLAKPPAWLPEEFYWVIGCSYRGMPQTLQPIRNPIGANMAFRREVFEKVGGFRNGIGRVGSYPVGCEETELCIRARQYWPQRTFLYQQQARVFHSVSSNRTSWRYFCSRCYGEGLSKAAVTRYVGSKDGLASERNYTLRTLPHGVMNNLIAAFLHRDFSALLRTGAITLGLTMTMAGYLMGKFFFNNREATYGAHAIKKAKNPYSYVP